MATHTRVILICLIIAACIMLTEGKGKHSGKHDKVNNGKAGGAKKGHRKGDGPRNEERPPGAHVGHGKKEAKILIDKKGKEHYEEPNFVDPDELVQAGHPLDESMLQTYQLLMRQGEEDDELMQEEAVHFIETGDLNEEGIKALKRVYGNDVVKNFCEEKHGGIHRNRRSVSEAPEVRVRRFALSSTARDWPKGIIPYMFDEDVPESAENRLKIISVMKEYERTSCVRFVLYNETVHADHDLPHTTTLLFGNHIGCWSFVGRLNTDFQEISACGDIARHELGHAFGSPHENRRSDANTVVQFYDQNVKPDGKDELRPTLTDNIVPYSLQSFMHYSPTYKSINGRNTIIPYNKDIEHLFKVEENFIQFRDGQAVNLAFFCKDVECPSFSLVCSNGGYVGFVDGVCQCVCPTGLTGPICEEPYQTDANTAMQWPSDGFTLPMPKDGCPSGFSTGTRTQSFARSPYTKTINDLNLLEGSVSHFYMTHHFCVATPGTFSGPEDFPAGTYCIYRTGGTCPQGFNEGYMLFDDVDHNVAVDDINLNDISGSLPDGVYDEDTKFYYCCRNDKRHEVPVKFPSDVPFQLLAGPVDDTCQEVEGMFVTKGGVRIATEFVLDDYSGSHPYYNENWKTKYNFTSYYYCYYEPRPSDCGGVYELTEEDPSLTITSPNHPADYDAFSRCYWTVRSPENTFIQIDFNHFDISTTDGTTCDDTLEIRHVDIVSPGVKYCGAQFDRTLKSYDRNVMFVLDSNSDVTAGGFEVVVSIVHAEDFGYDVQRRGKTYAGDVSLTQRSESCLFWDDVKHCPFSMYSNKDILGPNNYCRNPTEAARPWCYIDTDCYMDVCDISSSPVYDGCDDLSNTCDNDKNADGNFCSSPEAVETCRFTCQLCSCPDGYTEALLGKCYKVFTDKKIFVDAEQDCISDGGHVASIHSAEENEAIVGMLPSGDREKYFIGLNGIASEEDQVWSDGSSGEYEDWAPRPGNSDCTVLKIHKRSSTWRWYEKPCDKKYRYVCKTQTFYVATVGCNAPAPLPNTILVDGEDKALYQEGESLTYQCDVLYGGVLYGEKATRTCMTTGQWSGQDVMCGGCPANYVYLEPSGKCYHISDNMDSYDNAVSVCKSDGGTLAIFQSAAAEAAVVALLEAESSYDYLIGLNDKATEGTFLWGDGSSPSYTNWAPVSYLGPYDCVALTWVIETSQYMWDDQRCGAFHYICEVRLIAGLCADTRTDCDDILARKPNLCDDEPEYMMSACKETCGQCPQI